MRHIAAIVTVFALVTAGAAFADEDKDAGQHEAKNVTVKGEIVDLGCYLGHGATGAGHQACALNCIKHGMPMGILTDDGLFLLTMSHDDADPFNAAKEWAADIVEITGPVHEKDGMKSIEVIAAKKIADAKAPEKAN